VVASNWKSTAHTRFGASAVGGFRRRGRAQPLTTPALRNPQALFPPEPLDLLVVDVPARAAGVPVGVAEPAPRVARGPFAKPGPQGGRPALSLAVRVAASRGGLLLRPDRLLRFRKGLVRLEAENPGLSCGGEIADYCLTLFSIRAPNLFQYDNHEQIASIGNARKLLPRRTEWAGDSRLIANARMIRTTKMARTRFSAAREACRLNTPDPFT